MKLQGFTIIFALVAVPLVLVLTYYIQLQVNTITLQNQYDSKLLDATYDAMLSFELNTANEDLSSVSDSLRTIIEASNNVFFNTLATNLGLSNASKSMVDPYIPAILYTLYDGYYISAPTQVPTILTDSDGNAISVGDLGVSTPDNGVSYKYEEVQEEMSPDQIASSLIKVNDLSPTQMSDYGQLLYLKNGTTDVYTANIAEAKLETKNVLKTYMPYSARYKRLDKDITVVYTLDNYVTIEGMIREKYYTKSGYLLPKSIFDDNNDRDLIINADDGVDLLLFNQNDAQNYIEQGNKVKISLDGIEFSSGTPITLTDGTELKSKTDLEFQLNIFNNKLIDAQTRMAEINQGLAPGDTVSIQTEINNIQKDINEVKYALSQMSSVIYYVKATIFSNWVYQNLSDIEEGDLIEISGQTYTSINNTEVVTHEFAGSTVKVFDTDGATQEGITEIAIDSPYYNHKLNVIRNSIQYNLNLAMSTYNSQTSHSFSYEMPVMQNEEWSQILTNPSIVSFMQGYSCGLKIYNNYMVVSSTNNEINVTPENIYYVKKENFSDQNTEYHRIDCPELAKIQANTDNYISFTSKEVKYDKLYDKNNALMQYFYDHKNLACYDCINDGNYKAIDFLSVLDSAGNPNPDYTNYANLRRAYYIAVGKEKNDLYKMNAFDNSEGYEIIFNRANNLSDTGKASILPISNIKTIEIVLGTIKTRNAKENLRYEFSVNGQVVDANSVQPNSIGSNETNLTTIRINLDSNIFRDSNVGFSLRNLGVTSLLPNSTVYLNTPDEDSSANPNIHKEAFDKAVQYIRVIYK